MEAALEKKKASEHPAAAKYARFVNPAFVKLLGVYGYGRIFLRARDVWVWDHEGRKYLDFLAGFGSVNIGHNHPRLLERMKAFFEEERLNFVQVGPSPQASELAEALAQRVASPLEISMFFNSGSEAVGSAMKLACAATGRSTFLFCQNAYHGTGLGVLPVMGENRIRKPFASLLPESIAVPFGEPGPLKQELSKRRAAAFVVEPIQCEGGGMMPPKGYLQEAQSLCRRFGTLLVLDEVQTGLGRTGNLFAYESEGFVPDILVLAKSLGGAIAPIGVVITTPEIHEKAYGEMSRFDLNISTFGGNSFSCVAALETLSIIDDEHLVRRSAEQGAFLIERLRARLAGHPLVRDIRGRGLLVVIELGPTDKGALNRLAPSLVQAASKQIFGQWAALKLLENGILCQPAVSQWNVLKLEPPLTVGQSDIERFVNTLGDIFDEYRDISTVVKEATKRMTKQFISGWAF
jgi:putrescine aminotransferase